MKTLLKNLSAASLSAALVALVGCGSSPPPASATPGTSTPTAADTHPKADHKEHSKDHADFPAPVKAFHDELSPLWHADKGPDRVAKTCEKASVLKDKAVATTDKDLIDATNALVTECAKDGRPDFEAKFTAVHKQFHVVAKHDEHGEHHDKK